MLVFLIVLVLLVWIARYVAGPLLALVSSGLNQSLNGSGRMADGSYAHRSTGRPVHALLAVGILFAPFIFVWFLNKPGYSPVVRSWAFGWMLFVVGVVMIEALPTRPDAPPIQATATPARDQSTQVAVAPEPAERTWSTMRDGHYVKCTLIPSNDAVMYIFMPTPEGMQDGEQPVINMNPTVEAFEAMCGKNY